VLNSKTLAYYSLVAFSISLIAAPQVYMNSYNSLLSNYNSAMDKAVWLSRNLDSHQTQTLYKINLEASTFEEFGMFKDSSPLTIKDRTDLSQNNVQTGVPLMNEVVPMAENQLKGYDGCLIVTVRNKFLIYPDQDVNGQYTQLSKDELVTGFKRCK
jgi:hypothetical protein